MFKIEGNDTSQAADEGIFILQAKFDGATVEEYEFTIPLTYPKGILICTIRIRKVNTLADIICILDEQVHNQIIIFKQRFLIFKYIELFTMSKFESTEQFTSKNCDEIKMKRKSNLKFMLSLVKINLILFFWN